jgi:long-chain fatty acid transport protein
MMSASRLGLAALLFPLLPLSAHATNGMNMDAWGAKSGGMGGASFAYDSGNSAVMNNPATLGLREHERHDVGLGLTALLPTVASGHPQAGSRDSDGTAYYMPTVSWTYRHGPWTYGAAMLAQGGMGTEYGNGSSLFAGGRSMMGAMAPMSGEEIRSEVGVGRLMFPLAYRANDALSVAGQIDFVWATMDVRMDVDGSTFGQLVAGTPGVGSATGSLVNAFNGAIGAGMITDVNYARFDFSDHNDFSGKAVGTGWAGKLGIHYKLSDSLAVGATWHSKTHVEDLAAKRATVQMGVVTPGGTQTVPVSGKLSVLDFQWPETYGIGLAWQATNRLLLAADVKWIRWSDSMKQFAMKFEADSTQSNPMAQMLVASGGRSMTAALEQNWKDHTVLMLGGQYMYTPTLALRAGINVADNPVPDRTLNPLFPATVKLHYTFGFGWRMDKASTLGASIAYAPQVENTNANTGITSTHRQTTLRVNYNYSY